VHLIQRSPQQREAFSQIRNRLQLPVLELKNDCETRWSSYLEMLKRALLLKPAVNDFFKRVYKQIISSDTWEVAEGLISLLGPFADATKELSGDKYPTITIVRPNLAFLSNHLMYYRNERLDGNEAFQEAKDEALKAMLDYFGYTPSVANTGFFLDPNNKDLEIPPSPVYDGRKFYADTKTALYHFKLDYVAADGSDDDNQYGIGSSNSLASSSKRTFAQAFRKVSEESPEEYYLKTNFGERSVSLEEWWRVNVEGRTVHEKLGTMAKEILAIPATSVSSERGFSSAGLVVTKLRTRLSDESIKALMTLKSWYGLEWDSEDDEN
jgi:hypothetical protein